jgi:hydrogenase-4 component B
MSEIFVVLAIVLLALSGVPGLFLDRRLASGQWLSILLMGPGCILGIAGASLAYSPGYTQEIVVPWSVPGGQFAVALDGISIIFLFPIFVIALLGSMYGLQYWKQSEHQSNGRKLRLFYGLLSASMALVVVARNSMLFLAAWEIMALSAFFLVSTEDEKKEVREAGWIYLAATHTATLCLFALFAIWRHATGSFALTSQAGAAVEPGFANAIFLLALAGFGLKAGIMPLHIWLPSSHANAPSHVSALMSGVIIKMGIYGIVRFTALLPHSPAWWGALLLALGVISGVLGVAFAIGQHDIKRLLAYHSIENIGIILMGLGLALLGRALGRMEWVWLGLAAALLHVWNHALFKALLFLGAGSVIHSLHTREIDDLGGIAKKMPLTALSFLIGAVAICGLPPLNGFVSEFILYLGLFRTLGRTGGSASWASAAFAAPALALIGGLALACFVKVYGAVFLGTGRSHHVDAARESGPFMIVPMLVLAACCFIIGLAPALVSPVLDHGIIVWTRTSPVTAPKLAELVPFQSISIMVCALLGLIALSTVILLERIWNGGAASTVTWDCGYIKPAASMQYTSSSFAQMVVGFFAWVLRPRTHVPRDLELFPRTAEFHSDVPDTVLDRALIPASKLLAGLFAWFRAVQQQGVQAYLLYVFAILLILLFWQ